MFVVGVARGGGADQSRSGEERSRDVPFVALDPDSTSATDRAIADAQATLRRDPADDVARLDLAVAFLQKVRETGDPTLYTKCAGLLDDLEQRHPDDARVLVAQGTLALAQHRFEEARSYGEDALRLSPRNPTAYGILVDANNELGRYDEALQATEDMVDARPGLASYSRVSYARELRGDYDGAIAAMQQAVTSAEAEGGGENLAYVQTQLGQLLLTSGRTAEAAAAYDAALATMPGFPAARAGHAQVLVARERYDDAAALLAEVLEVQPLAQYAIAHGDALTAAGRTDDAQRAYELVDVISRLFDANGVRLDLELALFAADHDPGADAVAQARRALRERPSVAAHDVLAWNLYRVDELPEAAAESEQALALGGRDPLERFHAAMIANARGDRRAATEHLQVVLDTNPRFNARLSADVKRLAAELDLTVPPPAQ
jgi:tetratricopeptide (TPR) repeat protein